MHSHRSCRFSCIQICILRIRKCISCFFANTGWSRSARATLPQQKTQPTYAPTFQKLTQQQSRPRALSERRRRRRPRVTLTLTLTSSSSLSLSVLTLLQPLCAQLHKQTKLVLPNPQTQANTCSHTVTHTLSHTHTHTHVGVLTHAENLLLAFWVLFML